MKKVLLVIDDESSIRWILKVAFENQNITIIEASTGKEGIETAKQIQPDLIIMDYKMPDINGWQAAKEIQEAVPNTTIVGHTGYANDENIAEGIKSGCKEILHKPVDLDMWESVISKYLQ